MLKIKEARLRSKIIKAMAHPVRLMIIEFLKGGEKCFCHIMPLFDLDKSTVSKHLQVLKNAKILKSHKAGRDMIYSLECPCITEFLECITDVILSSAKKQIKSKKNN